MEICQLLQLLDGTIKGVRRISFGIIMSLLPGLPWLVVSSPKLYHEQIVLGEDRDDGDVHYTNDEPSINQRSDHSHIFWQVSAASRHPFAVVLSRCGVSRGRTYQKGQQRVSGHLNVG